MEQKVIRQEDQKLLREDNKEKNEQLKLLSDEQKMKKLYVTILILKPKKDQHFLAMNLLGD